MSRDLRSDQSPALRVLITTASLASRTGSELYARDVSLALLRRQHR